MQCLLLLLGSEGRVHAGPLTAVGKCGQNAGPLTAVVKFGQNGGPLTTVGKCSDRRI